jgi:carbohydrate-binding DOMON domain-containing protein
MFMDESGQFMDNTIFIVQYDYDLNNKFISLPINSVLLFLGGSFKNGTLILNNTLVLP